MKELDGNDYPVLSALFPVTVGDVIITCVGDEKDGIHVRVRRVVLCKGSRRAWKNAVISLE